MTIQYNNKGHLYRAIIPRIWAQGKPIFTKSKHAAIHSTEHSHYDNTMYITLQTKQEI